MIDYSFKELIAIGAELFLDTRQKRGAPEEIQILFGTFLLTLDDAQKAVLKHDTEAEYKVRLAEFNKSKQSFLRQYLANRFGDISDFE